MTSDRRGPAIEDLIAEHHVLLYRYAYRLCGSAVDADDLTQQTYLIAHEKLHQLRDPSSAKSWLCTILRHAYLRLQHLQPAMKSLDREDEHPRREAASVFDEEALQRALDDLPEDYRSAVILYYFQEMSYKDIADVLEIPLGTVMSRLSRGKAQLKLALESRDRRPSSPPHARSRQESLHPQLVSALPN
jgi:RNA polymerase sigma-70 factor, ECF subfamily